jgi:hypothetical protein
MAYPVKSRGDIGMGFGFVAHCRLVLKSGRKETWERLRDWLKGEALLASVTGLFAYFLSPGTRSERFIVAVLIPLAGLCAWIVLLFLWRTLLAPSSIYKAQADTISALRQRIAQLEKSTSQMAEEDPRVYLAPLNAEFRSNGFMVFELFNQGQRVNPAQGITVQPIPCAPLVRFDYVDCLLANEHKRVVPTIGEDFIPTHNILPELEKAWSASWEDGESDSEGVDFEFEIKLTYRDFRHRQFETTVTLKYFPLEYLEASRNILANNRSEYRFLKVINTEFKRLS